MFDVGWSEMLVIAIVLIVVVGPKDLPRMLRQFGRTTSKLRAMAGDFRRQFDEALKEADLEDVSETISSVRKINPMNEIRKHLAPIEDVGQQVRAGLDDALKPQSQPTVAETAAEPVATEPLKNGAAGLPGETVSAPKAGRSKKASARARAAALKASAPKPAAARAAAPAAASAAKAKAGKVSAAAPSKPAASKAAASKGTAAKAPAMKASASGASKPGAASAKRAPTKPAPAGRKKTESAR
jgi:sec-independent protein translocase protein TatB